MANVPSDLKYSKDHEWVRSLGDGRVRLGLTDFAQKQLGDIVFVELPDPGKRFEANDAIGSVESVKAVSEIYLPMAGVIATRNSEIDSEPELVNSDPYDEGWLVEITPTNAADLKNLLSAAEYEEYIKEEQ